MPDPKKSQIENQYEKARAARILELSRQWNVPTSAIFSQVKRGQRPREAGLGDENYASYWTFDAQGNINNSTRDYGQPLGVSYFTPEDIELQRKIPGRGMTVRELQATTDSTAVPINNLAAVRPIQPNMNWGGKMEGKDGIHIKPENKGKFTSAAEKAGMGVQEFAAKVLSNKDKYSPTLVKRANFARNANKWHKAEYGMDIPPYSYINNQIQPLYQDPEGPISYQTPVPQQPMDLQPLQTAYPQSTFDTSLQNPTPNIATRPTGNTATQVGGRGNKGIQFGSFNINLGTAISGLAGAANQAFEQQNVARTAARNQRLTLQQENYNPNQYGKGSSALYRNGGKIPDHIYDLSEEQIKFFKSIGYSVEKVK